MYRLIAFRAMKSVIFKTGVAVANCSGAVEADTTSKHGRSSTSLKSGVNYSMLIKGSVIKKLFLVFLLVGISFIENSKGNNDDMNQSYGYLDVWNDYQTITITGVFLKNSDEEKWNNKNYATQIKKYSSASIALKPGLYDVKIMSGAYEKSVTSNVLVKANCRTRVNATGGAGTPYCQ